MSREKFIGFARQSPLPNVKQWDHQYTCHMAALHWAWRALGNDLNSALAFVDNVCKQTCPKCTGVVEEGLVRSHASIQDAWYGPTFCSDAVVLDKKTMAEQVRPGDLIICGSFQRPQHSMVVVAVQDSTVMVRGFNNQGTFGLGVEMRAVYDDTDRDLATALTWEFPDPVCKVDGETFLRRVKEYGQSMRSALIAGGKGARDGLHFPLPLHRARQEAILKGRGGKGGLTFPGRPGHPAPNKGN